MANSLLHIRALTAAEVEFHAEDRADASSLNALKKEFAECKSRCEWCFAAERDRRIIGLVGYRAPAAHQDTVRTPATLILFYLSLPWEEDCLALGQELIQESFARLRALGVSAVKWDFDSADFWGETPQPRPHWEKRQELAQRAGMALRQEKINYRYQTPVTDPPVIASRLQYRTLEEVGEAAYLEAIRQVMDGTLDRSDSALCRRIGPEEAARRFFDAINDGMTYEPRLWKLAYATEGALVGLVAPLKMWGDMGTFGYIGVVPERRGDGFAVELLRRGSADLQAEGVTRVIADTDALNIPMLRTFEKVGYELQGRSWSYENSYGPLTDVAMSAEGE